MSVSAVSQMKGLLPPEIFKKEERETKKTIENLHKMDSDDVFYVRHGSIGSMLDEEVSEKGEAAEKEFRESSMQRKIDDALEFVRGALPEHLRHPRVGVICGSGLKNLGARLEEFVDIPFSSIPHYPKTSVAGHGTSMLVGYMSGIVTVVLTGRIHFYEGHSLQTVIFPTRVLIGLGVTTLLVTNAAGALNPDFDVGDIMIIEDHISFLNLAGLNPLRGANLDSFGPRFPSVTTAYHPRSFELVFEAAKESGNDVSSLRRGVYVMVGGPSYETNAEMRFLGMIGGSSVGMSSVPEVVCAAHAGINVVALSLITDSSVSRKAIKASEEKSGDALSSGPSHIEILAIAQKRSSDMESIVCNLVPKLARLSAVREKNSTQH